MLTISQNRHFKQKVHFDPLSMMHEKRSIQKYYVYFYLYLCLKCLIHQDGFQSDPLFRKSQNIKSKFWTRRKFKSVEKDNTSPACLKYFSHFRNTILVVIDKCHKSFVVPRKYLKIWFFSEPTQKNHLDLKCKCDIIRKRIDDTSNMI